MTKSVLTRYREHIHTICMKTKSSYSSAILIVTVFLLIGCHSDQGARLQVGSEKMLASAPATEQPAPEIVRKLIKEGRVEFETRSISETRQKVLQAMEKYKGYVSSDQEYNSPGRISNTLVVRIPADSFDDFLNEATDGVKKFEAKDINLIDVTEEFLDIQVRLKTKKQLETRYLELLKQAKSVLEILEIEKQIGQLRSEIESIEGRLNYLENRVSLSTLTITFYETIPTQTEFGRQFKNGLRNGWDNLIWFFVYLTNIWPFIIIGAVILLAIRSLRKKK